MTVFESDKKTCISIILCYILPIAFLSEWTHFSSFTYQERKEDSFLVQLKNLPCISIMLCYRVGTALATFLRGNFFFFTHQERKHASYNPIKKRLAHLLFFVTVCLFHFYVNERIFSFFTHQERKQHRLLVQLKNLTWISIILSYRIGIALHFYVYQWFFPLYLHTKK